MKMRYIQSRARPWVGEAFGLSARNAHRWLGRDSGNGHSVACAYLERGQNATVAPCGFAGLAPHPAESSTRFAIIQHRYSKNKYASTQIRMYACCTSTRGRRVDTRKYQCERLKGISRQHAMLITTVTAVQVLFPIFQPAFQNRQPSWQGHCPRASRSE
jgi:hypothetical protein